MKLVELVRLKETSDETFDALYKWAVSIGKTVVVVKDFPGVIVNRLMIPTILMEAVRMMERGKIQKSNKNVQSFNFLVFHFILR